MRFATKLALYLPLLASAQSLPVSTSVGTDQSGNTVLTIQNNSDQTVAAVIFTAHLVVKGETVGSDVMKYLDSAQGGWSGVGPHSASSIRVCSAKTTATVIFRGGMLSDGSQFGDTTWASHVAVYRQARAAVLKTLIDEVNAALSGNTAPDALLGTINTALSQAQSLSTPVHGVEDWIGEIARYKRQVAIDSNKFVIKNLSGLQPSDKLSTLSGELHLEFDRLTK